MNKKASLICFGVLSLVNGLKTLHAENSVNAIPPVVVGRWTISIERDEGGRFMDCSARAIAPDSRSGIDISILANANVWLTLTDASWQFEKKTIPAVARAVRTEIFRG